MSVFRLHTREKGFAQIHNDTLRDPRLSFRARGVLGFLLSQKPEFNASAETISEQGAEGRDAIRKALIELESTGYIVRERVQGEGGKWSTVVHVFERPCNTTDDWKSVVGAACGNTTNGLVEPKTGKPTVGKPATKDLEDSGLGSDSGLASNTEDGEPSHGDGPSPTWEGFEDVKNLLGELRWRKPLSHTDLFDPDFWRTIDGLTKGTSIYYDDELREYCAWLNGRPSSFRRTNHRRGFTNWIKRAISQVQWAERRRNRAKAG